jgi:membrane-bound serine protease (ClpP class)
MAGWGANRSAPLCGLRQGFVKFLPAGELHCRSQVTGRLLCCSALAASLAAFWTATAAPAASSNHPPVVRVATLDAEINPVSADWVVSQIHAAEDQHAAAFVLRLDTPGGLSDSMEEIVQAELAARLPVVVYVWPEGARAASAGFVIMQAADVAALAPTTNTGSAIPISSSGSNLGSDLRSKIINDARAEVRALATDHGRNAALAEGAVRPSSAACRACPRNWTAREAVRVHVADVVASSVPDLLAQIDGRRLGFKQLTVHVADARIDAHGLGWTTRLLLILTNANLLGLLFLLGIVGVAFELAHPGIVLPGLVGGVSLLLALLGLSIVPFSWAGLALLGLGLVLLAAEAHVPTHGAFASVGLVSAALGSFILFRVDGSPYGTISPVVIVIVTAAVGTLFLVIVRKVVAARLAPPWAAGTEALLGARVTALTPLTPRGQVGIDGERWLAIADDGPHAEGERLIVRSVDGLTLHVAPEDPHVPPERAPARVPGTPTPARGVR